MNTFSQFLEESDFYLGRTQYTCYFGRYQKIRNGTKETITPLEYYKARERYKEQQKLKLMRKHGVKRRKRIFKEESQFFHAVDSNPNLYKDRDGKKCTVFTKNYFHVFLYNKDGNHTLICQMRIVGNEELISLHIRRYGNEG